MQTPAPTRVIDAARQIVWDSSHESASHLYLPGGKVILSAHPVIVLNGVGILPDRLQVEDREFLSEELLSQAVLGKPVHLLWVMVSRRQCHGGILKACAEICTATSHPVAFDLAKKLFQLLERARWKVGFSHIVGEQPRTLLSSAA